VAVGAAGVSAAVAFIAFFRAGLTTAVLAAVVVVFVLIVLTVFIFVVLCFI
jgi:hypothetical protein